jgi:transposase-like protein
MFDITNPIFHDADKARAHLEANVWPEGPFCPHCGETENVHRLQGKSHRAGLIQCNSCLKNFTVTVGTVFERSKVPLNKWLLATYLMSSSKKGMSAHQIHRMLGVTYKTAWFMCHRIREAMDQNDGPLGGSPERVIEADETYVGGSSANRASKKVAAKKIVVTLVERNGQSRSFHVANAHANIIRPLLFQHADRLSSLMTDEARIYDLVGKDFWSHETVNHTWEYARSVKGRRVHTNTVENFFSIFKRGIIGVFHHVSEAHIGRYAREFDFRYNTREITDGERSDQALRGIVGKRLMYRRPRLLSA